MCLDKNSCLIKPNKYHLGSREVGVVKWGRWEWSSGGGGSGQVGEMGVVKWGRWEWSSGRRWEWSSGGRWEWSSGVSGYTSTPNSEPNNAEVWKSVSPLMNLQIISHHIGIRAMRREGSYHVRGGRGPTM